MAGETTVIPFNIGDVVWAKVSNAPWWPCKVLALDEDKPEEHEPNGSEFLVNFLGEEGNVCEAVKRKNIKPYWCNVNDTHKEQGRAKKNKRFHEAFLRALFEAEQLAPPPASQQDDRDSEGKNTEESNGAKQTDGGNDEKGSKRVREGKKGTQGEHRRKRQKGEGEEEEAASMDGEEEQPTPVFDSDDSNAQRDESGEEASKPPSTKKRKTAQPATPALKRAGSGGAKRSTNNKPDADGGVGLTVQDEDELPSVQLSPSQTPGTRVGDIVWVKHTSYPFWPAVIERVTNKKISYCFFGTMEHLKLRRNNIDKNVRVFPGDYKTYIANGKAQLEKRYQKNPDTKKSMIEVLERSAQKAREILYNSTRTASGKKLPRPDNVTAINQKYPTVCRKIMEETVTEETEDIVHASQVPPEVRANGWQETTLDSQPGAAPENGMEGGGSQDSQRDGEEGTQEEEDRPSQESDGEEEDDEDTEHSQAHREYQRVVQERYKDNVLEDLVSFRPQLDKIWNGTKTTPRADEFRQRGTPNKYFYSDLLMWWVVPTRVHHAIQQWLQKTYKPPIDKLFYYGNVMPSEALMMLVMKREELDYAGAEKFLAVGSLLSENLEAARMSESGW